MGRGKSAKKDDARTLEFEGGELRWDDEAIELRFVAGPVLRLDESSPFTLQLSSFGRGETRRLHLTLRRGDGVLLRLFALVEQRQVEGLSELDAGGARVQAACLFALIEAARALGATVPAGWTGPALSLPEPAPAPPVPSGPGFWQRHAKTLSWTAGGAMVVLIGVLVWALQPNLPPPPSCALAPASSIAYVAPMPGNEETLLVIDNAETRYEVEDDSDEGVTPAYDRCARVSVFGAQGPTPLHRVLLGVITGASVQATPLAISPAAVWTQVRIRKDNDLIGIRLPELSWLGSWRELVKRHPVLGDALSQSELSQRISGLPEGGVAFLTDDGSWSQLSPDGQTLVHAQNFGGVERLQKPAFECATHPPQYEWALRGRGFSWTLSSSNESSRFVIRQSDGSEGTSPYLSPCLLQTDTGALGPAEAVLVAHRQSLRKGASLLLSSIDQAGNERWRVTLGELDGIRFALVMGELLGLIVYEGQSPTRFRYLGVDSSTGTLRWDAPI